MLPGAMKITPGAPAFGPGAVQELDTSALAADFPGLDGSANSKLHLLYISCGENDGLLKTNQQFMDWLAAKGITYQKLVCPVTRTSGHSGGLALPTLRRGCFSKGWRI